MTKTLKELYEERNNRVDTAIRLEVPDRVPIDISFGYYPALYAGIPCSTVYYDPDTWAKAVKKTIKDFEPDTIFYVQAFSPGKALEYLDPKSVKWPGYGVSADHGHQAIEGEWMKQDEYDLLLNDPTDFILRVYLPRVVGAMAPFSQLPRLSSMGYGYFSAMTLAEALAKPEMAAAIEKLQKAGRELIEWRKIIPDVNREIEEMGFPVSGFGGGGAPFDQISDNLRGMAGTMIDMYRQPDRLLEACEKILENTLTRIAAMPQRDDSPRVFMALHRGSDGFMSLKDFEKFYWPGLKKVIIALVDKGMVPGVFFEGNWTARLEYLTELPKGRVFGHFDSTDVFRAKEVLNNHMCIRGNVPATLLRAGTVQDVKDYCKKLIDIVGKDGGLIVCPAVVPDSGTAENIHAMIDFTKEYGVYN
ncbi:MAG: uroporphyrinogen decarboxylase family protein [Dehalococcoidales bacterium]